MWTAFEHGNDMLTLIKDSQVDGLIIIEKNDKIKYLNPGAKKMLGLPETDFLETLNKTKFINEGGVTMGFSGMLSPLETGNFQVVGDDKSLKLTKKLSKIGNQSFVTLLIT